MIDLQETIKKLDEYYTNGCQGNHPIIEILTSVKKNEDSSYKIKIISRDSKNQVKKKTYENTKNFLRYGENIYRRHIDLFDIEIYKMGLIGWEQIEIPEDFKR